MSSKIILVTGQNLDLQYNRNQVILKGLEKLGYKIEAFSFNKFDQASAKQIRELSNKAYFTYIPSFGHKSVRFVKKNSACDVVFDPLISKYMTNVKDYNSYGKYSYESLRSQYRDKSSITKADFVIFDTSAHREYFLKKYQIPKEKTGVVHIGANNNQFDPKKKPKLSNNGNFRIGFVGHFIPLQGVLTILEAAKLKKDDPEIEFIFLGEGFEFKKALTFAKENDLNNVIFTGKVAYHELDAYLNSFQLSLGIFGDTLKSSVVIPNKIFNYASCALPILTMESKAIKEVFSHRENIYLCKPDAVSISEAISDLKNNANLRKNLGKNVFDLVSENYNEVETASSLISQYEAFKTKRSLITS